MTTECENKSFRDCNYGILITPFYIAESTEWHPGAGNTHLCANPLRVKQVIENEEGLEIIGLANPTGAPRLVYSADLGFSKDQPKTCENCPLFTEHLEGYLDQTVFLPESQSTFEELDKMNPECTKILA